MSSGILLRFALIAEDIFQMLQLNVRNVDSLRMMVLAISAICLRAISISHLQQAIVVNEYLLFDDSEEQAMAPRVVHLPNPKWRAQ